MQKKSKNYLNKNDMLKELRKFHETGIISEKLHNMVHLLCERLSRKPLYYRLIINKTIRCIDISDCFEEMIEEAYVKCLNILHKFSMDKTNPFSYFTSVVENSFKDYFKREAKYEDLKDKSQNDYIIKFTLKNGFRPSKTNYDEQEGI